MSLSEPAVVDTGKGYTLQYKDRFLYSSVDPLEAVRQRVENTSVPKETLVFVPSLGLGYGLRELLQRTPESSHILCVEADEKLMGLALREETPKLPVSDRLTIVRSQDPEAVSAYLHNRVGIGSFRRLQRVRLCAGYHLFADVYDGIAEKLEREIQSYWKNRIVLIHMGNLWIRNIIQNIPQLSSAEDIRALHTGYPICVMGAGPSLEDSLPTIGRFRDRMVLLAVDTALPVLSSHGIRPDIVLALEAQHANIKDFYGQDLEGTVLLCDITCHPGVIRLFRQGAFVFSSRFYPLQLLKRMEDWKLRPAGMPALGSVGVVGLHAALELTSEPVFLAGLDFSYPGKRSHAKGSPFHSQVLEKNGRFRPSEHMGYEALARRPLLELKDGREKPVLTDLVLHSYAQKAEELIAGEDRIYGFSVGGAAAGGLINGVKRLAGHALLRQLAPKREAERLLVRSGAIDQIGRKERWRRFVENEIALLARGIGLLEKLVRDPEGSGTGGRGSRQADTSEAETLAALDYLSFSFADKKPEGSSAGSYYARMLDSARRFVPLWERAEGSLRSGR